MFIPSQFLRILELIYELNLLNSIKTEDRNFLSQEVVNLTAEDPTIECSVQNCWTLRVQYCVMRMLLHQVTSADIQEGLELLPLPKPFSAIRCLYNPITYVSRFLLLWKKEGHTSLEHRNDVACNFFRKYFMVDHKSSGVEVRLPNTTAEETFTQSYVEELTDEDQFSLSLSAKQSPPQSPSIPRVKFTSYQTPFTIFLVQLWQQHESSWTIMRKNLSIHQNVLALCHALSLFSLSHPLTPTSEISPALTHT